MNDEAHVKILVLFLIFLRVKILVLDQYLEKLFFLTMEETKRRKRNRRNETEEKKIVIENKQNLTQ